eukprot:g47003.t1
MDIPNATFILLATSVCGCIKLQHPTDSSLHLSNAIISYDMPLDTGFLTIILCFQPKGSHCSDIDFHDLIPLSTYAVGTNVNQNLTVDPSLQNTLQLLKGSMITYCSGLPHWPTLATAASPACSRHSCLTGLLSPLLPHRPALATAVSPACSWLPHRPALATAASTACSRCCCLTGLLSPPLSHRPALGCLTDLLSPPLPHRPALSCLTGLLSPQLPHRPALAAAASPACSRHSCLTSLLSAASPTCSRHRCLTGLLSPPLPHRPSLAAAASPACSRHSCLTGLLSAASSTCSCCHCLTGLLLAASPACSRHQYLTGLLSLPLPHQTALTGPFLISCCCSSPHLNHHCCIVGSAPAMWLPVMTRLLPDSLLLPLLWIMGGKGRSAQRTNVASMSVCSSWYCTVTIDNK